MATKVNDDEQQLLDKIHYFLNLSIQSIACPICICKIKKDNEYEKIYAFDEKNNNFIFERQTLVDDIIKNANNNKLILKPIYGPIMIIAFAINDLIIILGPIVAGNSHNIVRTQQIPSYTNNLLYLHSVPLSYFISLALNTYAAITNDYSISYNDIIKNSFIDNDVLNNVEKNFSETIAKFADINEPHKPISSEIKILKSIEDGDLDYLIANQNKHYAGTRGTLSENPLRSEQNISIVDITLASRAAINGGMDVEESFTIADSFILEVEKATTIDQATAIKLEAQIYYTKLINEYRHAKNLYNLDSKNINEIKQQKILTEAKYYINTNISSKLTLKDICKATNISATGLQEIFKANEKMTVMKFIKKQKISTAAKWLKNTDLSIAQIAELLNFCSQSNFTEIFKEFMHETPQVYRIKRKI